MNLGQIANDHSSEEAARRLIAAVSGSNAARVLFRYRHFIEGGSACERTRSSGDRQRQLPSTPASPSGSGCER
jgi:hypothetical protein